MAVSITVFHGVVSLLLGGLAAGAMAPARAEPATDSATPPATAGAASAATETSDAGEVADSARSSVRAMSVWLARGVDSWFGDRPFEDGGRVSDGRLSAALLFRQHDKPDFDLRFNARFRLPNVEERIYGFIGRDDQRDVVTDKPGAFSRQDRLLAEEARDREFFAGLGRSLTDSVDLRLGLRGGLKPFVQARYREQWLLGPNDLADFRQTVFWTLDDHFGSTTALSYEHAFTPDLAARWLNSATITQESEYFEWSSLVGAYRSFGDQRVAALEALVSGEQGPGVEPSDYGVQVRWEQPVHEDWLLGGVVVGHFWPRENALVERRSAWAVGVSLKMRF